MLITKKIRISKNAIKIKLPDTNQLEDYSCGASGLLAIFGYYGVGVSILKIRFN